MKKISIFFITCIMLLTGCVNTSTNTSVKEINLAEGQRGNYLKIQLTFNTKQYKKADYYPSFALWVESPDGSQETIYATNKAITRKWLGGDDRPSVLPVWFAVREKELENNNNESVDTISSATPSGKEITIYAPLPEKFRNKDIRLFLEANISYDYNDYYRKGLKEGEVGYNEVNGQPSMVWETLIDTNSPSSDIIVPTIVGHGHVLGENGQINTKLSDITTAKEIFDNIRISYVTGE